MSTNFVSARVFVSLLAALFLGGHALPAQTTIEILEQPQDVFTVNYRPVTFRIVARAFTNGVVPAPVTYQWLEAGFEIPGATNATWVRPPSPACTNVEYSCVVRSGEAFRVSNPARLWIFTDCSPLSIVSVEPSLAAQQVVVTFSESVEPVGASDPFNYWLEEPGGISGPAVAAVVIRDLRTVVLHMDPSYPFRAGRDYILRVSGVTDLSDPACGCPPISETPWPFFLPSDVCAAITRQPESRLVADNCTATFEISARWEEGTPPRPYHFQWYRNGVAVPGATARTFTTDRVRPEHDGTIIHAVVLGACERLVSSNAVLRVSTNLAVVRLDSVKPGPVANSVLFSFSSPCGPLDGRLSVSGADPFNYIWSGDLATTQGFVDCTGTNVLLLTTPQQPGSNYVVTLSAIYEDAGYQLENGGLTTAEFTATNYPAVPPGTLRSTTVANQTVLEWAEGGVLQFAPEAGGPWENIPHAVSPHAVSPAPFPCSEPFILPARFYRVVWPAVPQAE